MAHFGSEPTERLGSNPGSGYKSLRKQKLTVTNETEAFYYGNP